MSEEICSGEVTWKDLKEKIEVAGVNDDTLVECDFLDICKAENGMMISLSTTRKMNGIFKPKISDAKKSEAKRYMSIIETLNEELYELHTANEKDKYRVFILESQIDKLIHLLATSQDKLLEVSETLIKERSIRSVLENG